MDRRLWIGVLIVFALGAAVFGIAQNRSLSQTEATLVVVQNTATAASGTQVAEATQAVAAQAQAVTDAQNIAATSQANALATAQSAEATAQAEALSQAQDIAATTRAKAVIDAQNAAATSQANALATAQSAEATAQAEALSQAQDAAATTQAQAVADAHNSAATTVVKAVVDTQNTDATSQAQAVEDAQNAAATSQANALTDAQNVAATAQASAVSAAENTAATAQAVAVSQAVDNAAATGQAASANQTVLENELATAQAQLTASIPTALASSPTLIATVSTTETPAATLVGTPVAAADTGTPIAAAETPTTGWTRVVGKGVAMQLPESFDSFNLLNGSASALAERMRALGPDFATAANFVEQNPDVFVLLAYDTRSKAGFSTNVLVLKQDVVVAPALQAIMDATIAQLPAQITVLSNDIVQVGAYKAGRLISETSVTGTSTRQIEYFIIEGSHVWIVVYTTTVAEYDDRLPVFDQSIQSIEFVPQN